MLEYDIFLRTGYRLPVKRYLAVRHAVHALVFNADKHGVFGSAAESFHRAPLNQPIAAVKSAAESPDGINGSGMLCAPPSSIICPPEGDISTG